MFNLKLRKELQLQCDGESELVFFDDLSFDNSILGLTDDKRVAYSYSKMAVEAMGFLECDEENAIKWIEQNTIASLGCINEERKPLIIYDKF